MAITADFSVLISSLIFRNLKPDSVIKVEGLPLFAKKEKINDYSIEQRRIFLPRNTHSTVSPGLFSMTLLNDMARLKFIGQTLIIWLFTNTGAGILPSKCTCELLFLQNQWLKSRINRTVLDPLIKWAEVCKLQKLLVVMFQLYFINY